MKNKLNDQPNNVSKNLIIGYFVILAGFLLFLLIITFLLIYDRSSTVNKSTTNLPPKITFHGPSPNMQIYEVPQPASPISVMGRKILAPPTGLSIENKKITSSAQAFSIADHANTAGSVGAEVKDSATSNDITASNASTSNTADTSNVSTALDQGDNGNAPVPELSAVQYGIAAGGSLPYFDLNYLDTYFSDLQSLGIKWVRWDIDWASIQPSNSASYNWTGIDNVVSSAERHGIISLGILIDTPEWARKQVCKNDWKCPPADPKTFGHFAGAAALRYKDRIMHWEIWNEPNSGGTWQPYPSTSEYTALLKEAYLGIKNSNPLAVVLSAGLAPAADEPGGDIAPLTFLRALYDSNGNQYFDAMGYHPYTYPALPTYVAPWSAWQQMQEARQLMIDNGDSAKKIWITEYGAPTGGPGNQSEANQLNNFTFNFDYMTEAAQSDILSEAVGFYKQNWDWLGGFFYYSLRDLGNTSDTPENFFGLVRYNGSQKPAYTAFRQAILSD